MLQKKSSASQYQNIPSTGFSSYGEKTTVEQVWVKNRISAFFSLSLFSIMQLIKGGEALGKGKELVEGKFFAILSKLFTFAMDTQQVEISNMQGGDYGTPSIELTRDEVKDLKLFLESRMANCEKERDERVKRTTYKSVPGVTAEELSTEVDKFNADTYISQKMLLIELREWLLGEETEEPVTPEPSYAMAH